MAKKGAVQLQIEVNSEEEWHKLLDKPGVIVADIYSEWCGPCVWMVPFLKKIKMDVYGDYLVLAIVNCETIECLSRFRGRSEPTWMFIRARRVIRILFGTNAPKLMEMMIEELQKEALIREGKEMPDSGLDFDELTPEEDVRYQRDLAIAREETRIKEENARKAFNEKRLQQCEYLLKNLAHIGVIFFYPHVGNDGMAAVSEEWDPLGLIVFNINRSNLTEEDLQNLMWYEKQPIPEEAMHVLLGSGQVLSLLVKPVKDEEDFDQDVDQLVLKAVYGEMRKPPGDPNCPASKVFRSAEEGGPNIPGMWAPCNGLSKAMALETLFPNVCKPHRLPEVEAPPPVITVVFDARKRQEALDVAKEYPDEILHYGFFTSADPHKATLIAKTAHQYQAIPGASLADKMVLCVAKRRSDAVLSLALHNPVYVSPTTEEGEQECAIFFPEDYESNETEVVETVTKKKKKHTDEIQEEETFSGTETEGEITPPTDVTEDEATTEGTDDVSVHVDDVPEEGLSVDKMPDAETIDNASDIASITTASTNVEEVPPATE